MPTNTRQSITCRDSSLKAHCQKTPPVTLSPHPSTLSTQSAVSQTLQNNEPPQTQLCAPFSPLPHPPNNLRQGCHWRPTSGLRSCGRARRWLRA